MTILIGRITGLDSFKLKSIDDVDSIQCGVDFELVNGFDSACSLMIFDDDKRVRCGREEYSSCDLT